MDFNELRFIQEKLNSISAKIVESQLIMGNMPGFVITKSWSDKFWIFVVDRLLSNKARFYAHIRWEQKRFMESVKEEI